MQTNDKEITDTERLDFIERNKVDCFAYHRVDRFVNRNEWGIDNIGNNTSLKIAPQYGKTIRESIDKAIDAAMRGKDGN